MNSCVWLCVMHWSIWNLYRKVMKRKKELSGLLEKNGATHHAPLRLEFLFHQTVFITVKIQEPMSPQPEASFRILFRIQLQKLQLI